MSRRLRAYFGDVRGHQGRDLADTAEQGDGDHRPVRLRKIDLHPLSEPHARGHAGRLRRLAAQGASSTGLDIYREDVDAVRVRRRVGMVFQKPNPFPTMSIRDNVLAGLRLNGLSVESPDAVVEETLRRVALWNEVKDGLGRSGTSLSGGQQQRLCIARAIALEPEVLLMDEPCSALDPIATARVEELMHELRDTYTIVIVTHNMQQAARVANYTAFFYMGELVEYDLTDVIFTKPKERRTEDYITGRFG